MMKIPTVFHTTLASLGLVKSTDHAVLKAVWGFEDNYESERTYFVGMNSDLQGYRVNDSKKKWGG